MASGIINVDKYGVLGQGNDSAIFQNALNSVPSQGGLVVYPAPVYVPTGALTITKANTHIRGAGAYATTAYPGVEFSGAVFDFTKGASVLDRCSIKGWGFAGAGTNQKIAIKCTDCSDMAIEDIAVDQHWTGSASIGLQLQGRDAYLGKKLTISADVPISIENNPNSTLDLDQSHFQDLYLTTLISTGAAVLIAPDINLTNIIFDGYQAYCLGKYGIFWQDTLPRNATSYSLSFKNIRHEQSQDATGYGIYIDHYIQEIIVEMCHAAVEGNGFYFRNCEEISLKNTIYYGTEVALNMDSTCKNIVLNNCFEQIGTTRSMTGLTQTFDKPPMEIWQPS